MWCVWDVFVQSCVSMCCACVCVCDAHVQMCVCAFVGVVCESVCVRACACVYMHEEVRSQDLVSSIFLHLIF